jgi:hypothetical protein
LPNIRPKEASTCTPQLPPTAKLNDFALTISVALIK